MNSRRWRLWLAVAILTTVLTAFAVVRIVAPPPSQAQTLEHPQVLVHSSKPFTESFQSMKRRDARIQSEIAAGIRPRPPRYRLHPEHEIEPLKKAPGPVYDIPFVAPQQGSGVPTPKSQGPSAGSNLRPLDLDFGFAGISLTDEFNLFFVGDIPPDTMGAVGPNHFVEAINGTVAIYTKSGTRLSAVTLDSFLTVTVSGTTYPRNGSTDPRIIFDRHSGRWFACAIDINNGSSNNALILAVSRTNDPTGTWDKYVIIIGTASAFADYESFGMDDNGLYFGATMFGGTVTARIMATQKASLIAGSPSLGTVYAFSGITDMYSSPQPAFNLDTVGASGKEWFVSSSTTFFANINYRTLTWSGGVPSLSSTSVLSTPGYPNYPPNAPASGTGAPLVDTGDDRLMMAVIRNNSLWTARTIGVDNTGSGSSADRAACEWFQLNVSGATPSITQNGRVFDTAASTPYFYYYPAINVSGQGHSVVGFSRSKATEFIAACECSRLSSDSPSTMGTVTVLQAGGASYNTTFGSGRIRWGDYSYTSVDPNDDMTLWTLQEYATATTDRWGTTAGRWRAPAPTLSNPSASGAQGTMGVILSLTGTGFYDPGLGFPNRLNVVLNGGSMNGISNYLITYNSPTSATVSFDIAANASTGARDIVLTNPDGQSATVTGGFTVTAAAGTDTTTSVPAVSGSIGQTVSLMATLTRNSDGMGVNGETISFSVAGASVGTAMTNSSGVATLSYTIPEGLAIGANTLKADFAGDSTYNASSDTDTLTVSAANTAIAVANMSGLNGQAVTLSATLTRTTDNAAVSGRSLSFTVDGSAAGSGTTDSSGVGSVSYTIPIAMTLGPHTIGVSFAGDSKYNSSNGSGTLSVKADTTLTVPNVTGAIGQKVSLTATLKRASNGALLASKTINFSVEGTSVGSAVTTSLGKATLSYKIPETFGTGAKTITATFAGDSQYNGSSGTGTLTINKADTTITVTKVSGINSQIVTLKATLKRKTDNAALGSKTVSFSVDGGSVGSAVTSSTGIASKSYTIPSGMALGPHTIGASFAGDSLYNASSGSGTLTVQSKTKVTVAPVTGPQGGVVTLSATLIRLTDSTPLASKTINFKIDGVLVGAGTTDINGIATFDYTIPSTMTIGTHTITGAFPGDSVYKSSSGTAKLTVTPP